MEDIIYILIGLAWVGYSAYTANQKKSQKKAALMADSQSIVNQNDDENEADAPTNASALIEQLFSGNTSIGHDEHRAQYSEIDHQEYNTESAEEETIQIQKSPQLRSVYEPVEYSNEKPDHTQNVIENSQISSVPVQEEEIFLFNLRQAVIHQAILNRPYF